MQKLLNILLIADLNSTNTCIFEDALRKVAKVITIGIHNQKNGRRVDFEATARPDIPDFLDQLPKELKPNLIIWIQPVQELIPLGLEQVSCQTLAIVEKPWEGLNEYLSFFRLHLSIEIDTARELNIPYMPFWSDEKEPHQVHPECLNKLFDICLKRKKFEAPDVYLDIIKEYEQTTNLNSLNTNSRSFIIPVLDDSPTSPWSIHTLLDDLNTIEGEVICIFNSQAFAEKIKNHKRIDRYAIMSENIGVGRAWNTGALLSTNPILFFLNADLKIGPGGVEQLSNKLLSHPGLAAVGPCGGFFDFEQGKDLYYLDQNKVGIETIVDQLSFHYFATRRSLFSEEGFQFYHDYLPCFMEEWDSALQWRKMGYTLLRVPVKDFSHQMGGSANSKEDIQCLGQPYHMKTILEENKSLYFKRWSSHFEERHETWIPNINKEPYKL